MGRKLFEATEEAILANRGRQSGLHQKDQRNWQIRARNVPEGPPIQPDLLAQQTSDLAKREIHNYRNHRPTRRPPSHPRQPPAEVQHRGPGRIMTSPVREITQQGRGCDIYRSLTFCIIDNFITALSRIPFNIGIRIGD